MHEVSLIRNSIYSNFVLVKDVRGETMHEVSLIRNLINMVFL